MKNKKNITRVVFMCLLFTFFISGMILIRGTRAGFGIDGGITGDVSVSYEIKYIANYPEDIDLVSDDIKDTVSFDDKYVINNNEFQVPLKYKFNGWNTLADGSGIQYEVNSSIDIEGGLDLYAQWLLIDEDNMNTDGSATDNDNKDNNVNDDVDNNETEDTGSGDDSSSDGDDTGGGDSSVVGSGTVTPGSGTGGGSTGSGTGSNGGTGNSSKPNAGGSSSNNDGKHQSGSNSSDDDKKTNVDEDNSESTDESENSNVDLDDSFVDNLDKSDENVKDENGNNGNFVWIIIGVICLIAIRLIIYVIKRFKDKEMYNDGMES